MEPLDLHWLGTGKKEDRELYRLRGEGWDLGAAGEKDYQPCKNSEKWSLATSLIGLGWQGRLRVSGEPEESALLAGKDLGVPKL